MKRNFWRHCLFFFFFIELCCKHCRSVWQLNFWHQRTYRDILHTYIVYITVFNIPVLFGWCADVKFSIDLHYTCRISDYFIPFHFSRAFIRLKIFHNIVNMIWHDIPFRQNHVPLYLFQWRKSPKTCLQTSKASKYSCIDTWTLLLIHYIQVDRYIYMPNYRYKSQILWTLSTLTNSFTCNVRFHDWKIKEKERKKKSKAREIKNVEFLENEVSGKTRPKCSHL